MVEDIYKFDKDEKATDITTKVKAMINSDEKLSAYYKDYMEMIPQEPYFVMDAVFYTCIASAK